ncbi:MAG: tyrosine-type recombinase/integrase [Brucella sp.]|nr:tyrosine-type recombinase/integrase [Bacillus sp. PR5]
MAKPTDYLQWHGKQYRVRLRVPRRLQSIMGTAQLIHPLHTADLKIANERKLEIVARMKADIRLADKAFEDNDTAKAEAVRLRIRHREYDDESIQHVHDRAEVIALERGHRDAAAFVEVARGISTPIKFYSDAFLAYKTNYGLGSKKDFQRVLGWMEEWCKANHLGPYLEDFDRRIAGRFLDESLSLGRSKAKAAAYLGFIREYWKWLKQRGHTTENPWLDQTLSDAPRLGRGAEPDKGKRPFTDAELIVLLNGPSSTRTSDLMRIAALSGMRIEEICQLRVSDCKDRLFNIRAGKTAAAERQIPIHTDLLAIVDRRTTGKRPDAFLIDDLPPVPESRESRSDPAIKEFTRYRRKQGVDERPNDKAKSNVDFHSFRRWFIRKARDAMHVQASPGYDEWTFPSVIGHTESDRPKSLDLSMMGYAGQDPLAAKRNLVEAVKLPSSTNSLSQDGT